MRPAVATPVLERLRRRRPHVGRPPAGLVALLVVAAIAHVAWSVVVAPLAGPDEDAHLAYVQRLVDARELPQKVVPGARAFSSEMGAAEYWAGLFQIPLNTLTKPTTTEAEQRAFAAEARRLGPEGRRDGKGFQPAANNPPLYYVVAAVPYAAGSGGDFFTRLQLARLGGLPFILIVVASVWLLCAELLPRPPWARVLAAGAVALHPQLTFMSGVVNPDVALAAVISLFLLVAVRLVTRGPTLGRALALGGVCAAAALVQPRIATVGVPAALALALAFHRHRVPWRDALVRGGASLGVAALGIVLYYAVVSVYGGEATKGQLQGTVAAGFNLREFFSYLWQFYWIKPRFLEPMLGPPRGFQYVWVESFFGVFGSLDVYLPGWAYDRLYKAAQFGLVLLAFCALLRGDALRRHWRELLVLVATMGTLLITVHYAAYRGLVGSNGTDPILVGRYLLPLIALFGLAIAFVATSLPRRAGRWFGLALLIGMLMLQLGGVGATLVRYHA